MMGYLVDAVEMEEGAEGQYGEEHKAQTDDEIERASESRNDGGWVTFA